MIKAASLKNNKNIPHPPLLFAVKLWKSHLAPSKQETELIHYPRHWQSHQTAFIQGTLSQVKFIPATVRNSGDGIQSSPSEQRQKPQLRRSHLLTLIKRCFYPDFFPIDCTPALLSNLFYSAISFLMGYKIRPKDHLSQFLAVLSPE